MTQPPARAAAANRLFSSKGDLTESHAFLVQAAKGRLLGRENRRHLRLESERRSRHLFALLLSSDTIIALTIEICECAEDSRNLATSRRTLRRVQASDCE